ncbi:unnamed protein product [Lactuca virosa]|uniref:Protein kinase domain-containing protein n=1 Tax=Lactuca virosa TaxID=75947 RepID=A0AAU9MLL4_9ASTR|nr:unnamed protein product [Lactuca virosa]
MLIYYTFFILLKLVLSIKPNFSQSLNNLGVVYTVQGKMDVAASMNKSILAMNYINEGMDEKLFEAHRNVLQDEAGRLKVADFGLSKIAQEKDVYGYKMTGGTGSYQYMAPEVYRRESYGKSVDVFSFALIIHENLINLVGSKSSKAETTGIRTKEGAYINKSLLTFGTVISKLSDGRAAHIPYRDSKLTRLLQSSLSGHGRVSSRLALKLDGLFLAAIFGGETLKELRIACTIAHMEREGGMTSRETEKVVDDPQLPVLHRALVETSAEVQRSEQVVVKNKETLNQLKELNAEQERDVERVRQRDELYRH